MAGAEQALLRVQDVAVRFGGIVALDGVSFVVPQGRIVGLIGPNGAGKTTLFNCISRLYPCERGDIAFAGRSLLRVPRHRIAALGIGRTFQNLALFRTMSVLENVMVGRHSRSRGGFFAAALRLPYATRADAESRDRARELHALLRAEGQRRHRRIGYALQLQQRKELASPVARLGIGTGGVGQAQRRGEKAAARAAVAPDHHVLEHAHRAEQREVLERAPDAERGDAMARDAKQRAAGEGDVAALARVKPRNAVEERGLAGTVRADQADDASGRDVEGHAVEGHDAAEMHGNVLHAQQRLLRSRSQRLSSSFVLILPS